MKKNLLKVLGYTAVIAGLTLATVEPAMAQVGLDKVTKNVTRQMPGIADVLSAVAYIAGIGFGIKAALKLKEHNETKGQVPLSQPMTLGIVAALLLALPSFLTVAKQGVFGAGSKGSSLDSGSMRTIDG